jgi:hypothetical protein
MFIVIIGVQFIMSGCPRQLGIDAVWSGTDSTSDEIINGACSAMYCQHRWPKDYLKMIGIELCYYFLPTKVICIPEAMFIYFLINFNLLYPASPSAPQPFLPTPLSFESNLLLYFS